MEASIEMECAFCEGTGVYRGPEVPELIGILCSCKGSGKVTLKYKPFTERKRRDDVLFVRLPGGGQVSYDEFLAGGQIV